MKIFLALFLVLSLCLPLQAKIARPIQHSGPSALLDDIDVEETQVNNNAQQSDQKYTIMPVKPIKRPIPIFLPGSLKELSKAYAEYKRAEKKYFASMLNAYKRARKPRPQWKPCRKKHIHNRNCRGVIISPQKSCMLKHYPHKASCVGYTEGPDGKAILKGSSSSSRKIWAGRPGSGIGCIPPSLFKPSQKAIRAMWNKNCRKDRLHRRRVSRVILNYKKGLIALKDKKKPTKDVKLEEFAPNVTSLLDGIMGKTQEMESNSVKNFYGNLFSANPKIAEKLSSIASVANKYRGGLPSEKEINYYADLLKDGKMSADSIHKLIQGSARETRTALKDIYKEVLGRKPSLKEMASYQQMIAKNLITAPNLKHRLEMATEVSERLTGLPIKAEMMDKLSKSIALGHFNLKDKIRKQVMKTRDFKKILDKKMHVAGLLGLRRPLDKAEKKLLGAAVQNGRIATEDAVGFLKNINGNFLELLNRKPSHKEVRDILNKIRKGKIEGLAGVQEHVMGLSKDLMNHKFKLFSAIRDKQFKDIKKLKAAYEKAPFFLKASINKRIKNKVRQIHLNQAKLGLGVARKITSDSLKIGAKITKDHLSFAKKITEGSLKLGAKITGAHLKFGKRVTMAHINLARKITKAHLKIGQKITKAHLDIGRKVTMAHIKMGKKITRDHLNFAKKITEGSLKLGAKITGDYLKFGKRVTMDHINFAKNITKSHLKVGQAITKAHLDLGRNVTKKALDIGKKVTMAHVKVGKKIVEAHKKIFKKLFSW